MSSKQTESYSDSEFLQNKHNAFNTSAGTIALVVQKAVSSKPVSSKKIILGEENEVYDITTENGRQVILRISHSSEPRFKEEKWALDSCRNVGVPTPRILLIDQIDNEMLVCVEEKLPGRPLGEVYQRGTIDSNSKNLVLKAGKILAKIHSIKVEGFGQLDQNGKGKFKTWEDYMLNDNNDELRRVVKKTGIDLNYIDKAFEILIKHKVIYQTIEPRLLHSDFSAKHLLIEKNEITGVLDMENCKGGDITRDFAWWDYFNRNRFPVEWLIEGYGDSQVFTPEFKMKMKLSSLQLGIILLYYYEITHNQNGINYTKEKLVEDIGRFD